ncbi:hypothetical protein BX616_005607 [Lobosporangium transversale]|uniref:Uncharacterized protein n=1 Tax=Lobosporangium transversale TaxID=64571 RepID=A0A1Y2G9A4_9FUNG|nr:hypothetical protein BCR41DRAFT_209636 [Lobosporangium transversale]KAF9918797.1 hypothetical protein BX616_005607 [Lobosporangium transversale]ORZ01964.1 hypothetical protein BCR41DRAFT_209636 [Lobosporangium transversale]|eukprot:XP_021876217.1 hypothetical protein BCR41DRAFT_209636 [Lobosporangium transversale]
MADTTAHAETHPAPAADTVTSDPAANHTEEKKVDTTTTATEPEPEPTFSTQVEPYENPVLNADDTPIESAPIVAATSDENPTGTNPNTTAPAEGEAGAEIGSDKKPKSWIAKLTSNIKKLTEKKPKVDKAAHSHDTESPAAATTDVTTPATTEAEGEGATSSHDATAEDNPAAVTETEAEVPTGVATEHVSEVPPKLTKRLSFNIFKKLHKADKEKEKTAVSTPTPIAEASEATEGEATTGGEEAVAPPPPSKDNAPVVESTSVPSERAVEETALAPAH